MDEIDKGARHGISPKYTRINRIELRPPSLNPAGDMEGMQGAGPVAPAAPVPQVTLGGVQIAAVDRRTAAGLLITAAHRRDRKPFYSTSANGEVLARIHADKAIAQLFQSADQILADGQPLVFASRWLCRKKLPERVATTDLFHDVAKIAERERVSFYLFGASELENSRAAAAVQRLYPALLIAGRSHGYLTGAALEHKVEEINRLAPDILWLGLGVPREQLFVRDFLSRLDRVGVIKTAGGLFDHLAGKTPRAPLWMQRVGLEWFWRALMEPRRLLWRYLTTNPRAFYLLLRYSQ